MPWGGTREFLVPSGDPSRLRREIFIVAGERIGGNADDAPTAAASETVGLGNNPVM